MNDNDFRLIAITGKLAGYRKAANLTQEDKGQKKMKVKDEVGITRSLMSKEFVENFIEKYILGVD